jgi:hypothetical protein
MRETMKTDIFTWHGYAELWIEGAWRKATPVFNIELCDKFGLHALDWDGLSDSLYHPHDKEGRLHMEYVQQRGSFDDMPLDQIRADFAKTYPNWSGLSGPDADFAKDVDKEVEKIRAGAQCIEQAPGTPMAGHPPHALGKCEGASGADAVVANTDNCFSNWIEWHWGHSGTVSERTRASKWLLQSLQAYS